MADEQFLYDYKEVVEALLKRQGIHEGEWRIFIEFGLGAMNIKTIPEGPSQAPAAIATVQKIGIKRAEEPSNLSVNAAEVNPAPKGASKAAKKGKR